MQIIQKANKLHLIKSLIESTRWLCLLAFSKMELSVDTYCRSVDIHDFLQNLHLTILTIHVLNFCRYIVVCTHLLL